MANLRRANPGGQKARRSGSGGPPGTLVLLVRHGNTSTTGRLLPGRAPGLHLSERGKAQAAAVAERIAELGRAPVAVYASPLERTKETAAPIARALGLRVRSLPGLLECDVGQWTGSRLGQLARRADWQRVRKAPSAFRFPGGESFAEMSTRAHQAVVDLGQRHPGQSVVAVSHADPIKAIAAAVAGVPLDLFQRLVVSPCSVTALVVGNIEPLVLCVNSTASLAELVPS